ncbi:YIEGIA family protein [Mangrovibacillus cuniculi]|uniref:YIEGIA protein n=1 Tax=Mangrovibacillus cuniculi TaxID=2593652 RepID=A0A7S8CB29_9BACI|nr:YIEGIA family protein [Mangrovibacillus cuniculi]QPC46710.1 hypothetical protein G8O30_06915 [Mangrovibacillus cuniculi]
MNEYVYPILLGVISGTLTRMYMLRTDYRQYPTHLHGKIIHIALGFIAAGLGTIAIPAIMEEEFTAITFLTLAASQFREVRNMERETLSRLDGLELVPRGATYIEGIAMAFESRNYLVIFTSLLVTFSYLVFNFYVAIIVAIVCFYASRILMDGSHLGDIVEVEPFPIRFDGAGLYIDNIYIMNIGLRSRQEQIMEYGMGFILTPKSFDAQTTISNLGQRQAILHDMSTALGIFKDSGNPALAPLAKRDLDDGRVGVFVLPQVKDEEKALEILRSVPTLEHAVRMPTESKANKKGRKLK